MRVSFLPKLLQACRIERCGDVVCTTRNRLKLKNSLGRNDDLTRDMMSFPEFFAANRREERHVYDKIAHVHVCIPLNVSQ